MVRSCAGCKEDPLGDDVYYYRFPKDVELKNKWIMALKVAGVRTLDWFPSKSTNICSRHFRPEDLTNSSHNVKKPKAGVLPTIFKLRKMGRKAQEIILVPPEDAVPPTVTASASDPASDPAPGPAPVDPSAEGVTPNESAEADSMKLERITDYCVVEYGDENPDHDPKEKVDTVADTAENTSKNAVFYTKPAAPQLQGWTVYKADAKKTKRKRIVVKRTSSYHRQLPKEEVNFRRKEQKAKTLISKKTKLIQYQQKQNKRLFERAVKLRELLGKLKDNCTCEWWMKSSASFSVYTKDTKRVELSGSESDGGNDVDVGNDVDGGHDADFGGQDGAYGVQDGSFGVQDGGFAHHVFGEPTPVKTVTASSANLQECKLCKVMIANSGVAEHYRSCKGAVDAATVGSPTADKKNEKGSSKGKKRKMPESDIQGLKNALKKPQKKRNRREDPNTLLSAPNNKSRTHKIAENLSDEEIAPKNAMAAVFQKMYKELGRDGHLASNPLIFRHKCRREGDSYFCELCNVECIGPHNFFIHAKHQCPFLHFVCPICNIDYRKPTKLKDHLAHHANERKFVCEVCGRAFNQKAGLRDHMLVHSDAKPFQCVECHKLFKSKENMRKHEKYAHNKQLNPMRYKVMCEICSKQFTAERWLKMHMAKHRGVDEFICACGKKFATESGLKVHQTLKNCGYNREFNAESLTAKKERNLTNCGQYFCDKCGEGHLTQYKLEMHKKKLICEDPEAKKRLMEQQREESMRQKRAKYAQRKSEPGKYQCKICLKLYKCPSALRTHLDVHSEEKKHTCFLCGKKFAVKTSLQVHMKKHSSNVFKCTHCEKSFVKDAELKMHMISHSKERAFHCHCGKSYKHKVSLALHIKRDHENELDKALGNTIENIVKVGQASEPQAAPTPSLSTPCPTTTQ